MKNKRISIHSKYKTKISFDDYSSVNDIIVSYYLPLIRSEAFSLYQALIIDARNPMINSLFVSIERIISMINLSIDDIEKAISRLELVDLIKVLKDSEDKLIFSLKKPLSPLEFNNSTQMIELLKSSAGNDNLEINNKLFNSMKNNDQSGFESTTKDIDLSVKKEVKKGSLNVGYDFDSIKNILISKGINWNSYWTKELEQNLLNLIIIYRVTAFDISLELIKEIENGNFNIKTLVNRIKNDFSKNKNIDSIISAGEQTTEVKLDFLKKVPVKDYFIHKLNRLPSPVEEKMITKLVNEYGFDSYQINVLIDYSIIVNDGAINENYIYKISNTINKQKIDTPEKLIQHLKISYKMKNNNHTKKSINSNKEMIDKPIF